MTTCAEFQPFTKWRCGSSGAVQSPEFKPRPIKIKKNIFGEFQDGG
jgi:hypothetical protein